MATGLYNFTSMNHHCSFDLFLAVHQAVSSMSGKVLDTWMLKKPPEWQPDYVVRNLFEQYFISNYTETDFLERTGA